MSIVKDDPKFASRNEFLIMVRRIRKSYASREKCVQPFMGSIVRNDAVMLLFIAVCSYKPAPTPTRATRMVGPPCMEPPIGANDKLARRSSRTAPTLPLKALP